MSRKPNQSVSDSPEWAMVLDNLEQMRPRYLASLLRNGGLENIITDRLRAYAQTLQRLQEKMPGEPLMNLQEIANEVLMPVNPNWQDEEPLTEEEQKLLEAFNGS
jgi:hypothetical protein